MKVQGSKPFSVPANNFAISASSNAYTLMYSADGVTFDSFPDEVAANSVQVVTNVPKGMIYMLSGNTDEVYIQY